VLAAWHRAWCRAPPPTCMPRASTTASSAVTSMLDWLEAPSVLPSVALLGDTSTLTGAHDLTLLKALTEALPAGACCWAQETHSRPSSASSASGAAGTRTRMAVRRSLVLSL
jgi:hypothetical protein